MKSPVQETSLTPELYWIPVEAGRLAIMARPRAGEWLGDEIAGWRREGVDVVVCLLEPAESRELELDDEAASCINAGIEFIVFPIRDRGVPRSMPEAARLADLLVEKLRSGAGVAIHCRAGIGRSSLMAACTMSRLGIMPNEAFELITHARGVSVPDSDEQAAWVKEFSRH